MSKISDEGIVFRSHVDGSRHTFTPESAILGQLELGADIIMCLDQCIAHGESREAVARAMERTHSWAARCKEAHAQAASNRQALFGIVQGGAFSDLRRQSAEHITSLGFQGYAVGGLAVGESKAEMYRVTGELEALLPRDRPRYMMGVGSPEDLVECVARGMDLFDCALPTRVARNGALFTEQGRVDITSGRFRGQTGPFQEECDCYAFTGFSAGYLHHLFKAKELLGLRLASLHNLRFVLRLMERMRQAVLEGRFEDFSRRFLETYTPTSEAARLSQKEGWMRARMIRGEDQV